MNAYRFIRSLISRSRFDTREQGTFVDPRLQERLVLEHELHKYTWAMIHAKSLSFR